MTARPSLRDFVGIDLSVESVPDATTVLKFRHLLEKQALTQVLFKQINDHLAERGANALRHDRRRYRCRRAPIHEELGQSTGSGDAPGQKRQ